MNGCYNQPQDIQITIKISTILKSRIDIGAHKKCLKILTFEHCWSYVAKMYRYIHALSQSKPKLNNHFQLLLVVCKKYFPKLLWNLFPTNVTDQSLVSTSKDKFKFYNQLYSTNSTFNSIIDFSPWSIDLVPYAIHSRPVTFLKIYKVLNWESFCLGLNSNN